MARCKIVNRIYDIKLVSPVQCVPKKGGMNVVSKEKNELILSSIT